MLYFGYIMFPPPENQPPGQEPEIDQDEPSAEEIAVLANRWRNLVDSGFTAEEAFTLCGNPHLDWHFAARLFAQGCPFDIILNLTSP